MDIIITNRSSKRRRWGMRKRDGRGRAAWREEIKNEDDDEQKDTEKEGETVDEGRRRTGRVGKS